MYKSIHIQNFRGLRDLRIEDLGRVNLLVGANNVGKTSVLEALALLHLGSDPIEFLQIATRRQTWPYGVPADLFGSLSWDQTWAKPVEVLAQVDVGDAHAGNGLLIAKDARQFADGAFLYAQQRLVGIARDGRSIGEGLILAYVGDFGDAATSIRDLPQFAVVIDPVTGFANASWPPAVFGPAAANWSGRAEPEESLALSFSPVKAARKDKRIIQTLQKIDDRVEDVYVDTVVFAQGANAPRIAQPVLRIQMSGLAKPLSPAVLGAGAARMLQIQLALLGAPDGIAVIDEIDEGIYFERMTDLWRMVRDSVSLESQQIFATTHSWECVEAAVKAFRETPEDFRLHRLERRGDDVSILTYDYELAEAAVMDRIEVR